MGAGLMLHGAMAVAQTISPQESSSRTIKSQDLDLLRKDLRAMRKQLIAQNLRLTEDEAAKFWPVYDQYIKELITINDRKFAVIQDYADNFGKMTNDQSLLFIRQWLDADIAQTQLRQKYVPIIAKVLDGKKTATFFQLDRRIAMMLELQVASQMPLVQDQQ
jgi:soluble lytic murein transglycosylase-like protein